MFCRVWHHSIFPYVRTWDDQRIFRSRRDNLRESIVERQIAVQTGYIIIKFVFAAFTIRESDQILDGQPCFIDEFVDITSVYKFLIEEGFKESRFCVVEY